MGRRDEETLWNKTTKAARPRLWYLFAENRLLSTLVSTEE